jgi:hypothetical protein
MPPQGGVRKPLNRKKPLQILITVHFEYNKFVKECIKRTRRKLISMLMVVSKDKTT